MPRTRSPLAVLVLCAGCVSQPATSPATGHEGVSASEAKSLGAFTAPYDARLDLISSGRGQWVLRLVNRGQHPDDYTFVLDPAAAGRVTPARLHLAVAEEQQLTVDGAPATIRVLSRGRNAEIAAIPLS
ncbi:hypothetical protein GCM10009555_062570 [Acrocarpospora macrocephala]|uniref:Uncharacterized protein n=1 Tax=Acrocarpospora macrocephala TaxID=150177 RepID=A0A5M3WNC1_9ACTN|nr:hypothetical protein [Acrocarpospora macrocephala]GES07808.1 hypothetical protein Amac_014030 [Acrocarpospora macrocephala]